MAVRQVRRDPRLRCLPIIFLTAGDGVVVDALDAGADDHLPKPFRPEELRARVRAALRIARHRAEAETERDLSNALVESLQDGLLVMGRTAASSGSTSAWSRSPASAAGSCSAAGRRTRSGRSRAPRPTATGSPPPSGPAWPARPTAPTSAPTAAAAS